MVTARFLRRLGAAGCILLLTAPVCLAASEQTVRIPFTLDYSLIRSFFVSQAYTQPGERAVPVDLGGGCSRIELWQPEVGPEQSFLKLASNMRLKLGLPLGNACLPLSDWQGTIDVLQRISVDPQNTRLRFDVVEFRAFSQDGRRAVFDRVVTDFLKTYLNPFLGQVGVDLSIPLMGLKTLLRTFFVQGEQARVDTWAGTMRLGQLKISPEAVGLDVLMNVDKPPRAGELAPGPVSDGERASATRSWENLDAFALSQVESLMNEPVTDEERANVAETLLDARYDFVRAQDEGSLEPTFMGRQFVDTWQQVSPVMRKYLSRQPGRSPLDLLTFFVVSDAVSAFSKIGFGPTMTVNAEGLLRLAGLMTGRKEGPGLTYSYAVRPDLRAFMGLDAPLDESGPAFDAVEADLPGADDPPPGPGGFRVPSFFGPPPAWAAEPVRDMKAITPWVLLKGKREPYLDRVKAALQEGATGVLSKGRLHESYHTLFRQLVLSTAWQESCWRQFIGTGNKVRTLLSYNQSSVGLMQINERVWRGIYRPENLRWNAAYNIRAGCEILELYLRRYALAKKESKTLDRDTLARAVYAMYNGGPGQFKKFLARSKTNKLLKTDKLFGEKYSWVKAEDFGKLGLCLGP